MPDAGGGRRSKQLQPYAQSLLELLALEAINSARGAVLPQAPETTATAASGDCRTPSSSSEAASFVDTAVDSSDSSGMASGLVCWKRCLAMAFRDELPPLRPLALTPVGAVGWNSTAWGLRPSAGKVPQIKSMASICCELSQPKRSALNRSKLSKLESKFSKFSTGATSLPKFVFRSNSWASATVMFSDPSSAAAAMAQGSRAFASASSSCSKVPVGTSKTGSGCSTPVAVAVSASSVGTNSVAQGSKAKPNTGKNSVA
mmetsp:Transcript_96428/g.174013  ORF Transcript_96428/g.174013 Transcript_96428/m.174013 type:complete len:259 (-) Transcript_96428:849-1625(-)